MQNINIPNQERKPVYIYKSIFLFFMEESP